jgi:hypothetical protein
MAMKAKADYASLEKMYVLEEKTYSALARFAGVSPQSVAEYARRHDWPGKRAAYQSSLSRRGYENVAATVASQTAEIKMESISVARATLRAYANALVSGQVVPTAKDAALMIDLLAKELVPDDGRDHESTIVSTISPDSDFLRRVVDAARGKFSGTGDVEGAILGGSTRTRSN